MKILKNLVAIILVVSLIVSCAPNSVKNDTNNNITNNETLDDLSNIKIVTTIFPIYDWCKNILGDKFDEKNVSFLLDSGVDLHNYQLTVQDIVKIGECDLFIYVGGESDKWVDSALSKATNKNMKVLNLIEVLGDKVKIEEEKEGMQEEEEESEMEEHEEEIDEHVWLSLRNAEILVNKISKSIIEIDKNNSDYYKNNTNNYIKELKKLDDDFKNITNINKKIVLIFGDRFPFRYLVDDYNIDYYAAFKGCSAETEASFETIAFLSNKLDELDLNFVMTIEGDNHNIAQTIINNSSNKNRNIYVLNSMQGITKSDLSNGISYLDCMYENKQVLEKALKE